jgi:hypothetical protein
MSVQYRRFAMAKHSVVGVYKRLAEDAVRALGDGGFPIEQVSIITRHLEDDRRVHGYVTACDVAKSAAATGARVGGIFGVLAGAAFLWLPGVGPQTSCATGSLPRSGRGSTG